MKKASVHEEVQEIYFAWLRWINGATILLLLQVQQDEGTVIGVAR